MASKYHLKWQYRDQGGAILAEMLPVLSGQQVFLFCEVRILGFYNLMTSNTWIRQPNTMATKQFSDYNLAGGGINCINLSGKENVVMYFKNLTKNYPVREFTFIFYSK